MRVLALRFLGRLFRVGASGSEQGGCLRWRVGAAGRRARPGSVRSGPSPGPGRPRAAGWSLGSGLAGILSGSAGGVASATAGGSLGSGAAGVSGVAGRLVRTGSTGGGRGSRGAGISSVVGVSAVGGVGGCVGVGGLEGWFAVAVDYSPVVVVDVVVAAPAHEHQVVDVGSPQPGVGHDVVGLALFGSGAATDAATVAGDEHPPLGSGGSTDRGAVVEGFAVSEDDAGELGITGDALQHLRWHRSDAGDLAAPGQVLAGEHANVGHSDDLGFGPPPGAAGPGSVGVAGGEQVQSVGPELIPRPQTLASA